MYYISYVIITSLLFVRFAPHALSRVDIQDIPCLFAAAHEQTHPLLFP